MKMPEKILRIVFRPVNFRNVLSNACFIYIADFVIKVHIRFVIARKHGFYNHDFGVREGVKFTFRIYCLKYTYLVKLVFLLSLLQSDNVI